MSGYEKNDNKPSSDPPASSVAVPVAAVVPIPVSTPIDVEVSASGRVLVPERNSKKCSRPCVLCVMNVVCGHSSAHSAPRLSTSVMLMLAIALILVIAFAVSVGFRQFATGALDTCSETVEGRAEVPRFENFDSCGAMFSSLHAGACGWNYQPVGGMVADGGDIMFAEAAGTGASSARTSNSPGQSAATDSDFSGTNVQEEGVDEADIVKTDGKYVYTLSSSTFYFATMLTITNITNPQVASTVASIDLYSSYTVTGASGLFLAGDRLLVVGQSNHFVSLRDPQYPSYSFSTATYLLFDISNRAAPTLMRRVDIEGFSVAARMVNDEVYAVVGSWPHRYAFGISPSRATAEDILPFTRDTADGIGVAAEQSRLLASSFLPIDACRNVGYSTAVNPDGTVTVVGFSLRVGSELLPLRTATVAGRGFNVYASTSAIYVASGNFNWRRESTSVLVFDMLPGTHGVGPGARFRGMADVPGTILSQWSLDEGPGDTLRVATHTSQWSMPLASRVLGGVNNVFIVNASRATGVASGSLFPVVGSLLGLAPGEKIYATRFMGDRLYMVTFVRIGTRRYSLGTLL